MTKIALITGTSTGIGLATTIALARAGFTVVATMRDLSKAGTLQERAQKEGVTFDLRQLDVCEAASVQACVEAVQQDYGPLEVLVNNAGVGYLGALEKTPFEAMQHIFEVNFYGVWRVTQAVLPLMRAARTGRIITVSSVAGILGTPFNDAYSAAKFAVEGLMESLAPLALHFGLHVSLIEPGPVATEFVASRQQQELAADDPYSPILAAYGRSMRERFVTARQTSDDIAAIILEAATAEKPHLRYLTSPFAESLAARKYVDPTGDSIRDMMVAMMQAA